MGPVGLAVRRFGHLRRHGRNPSLVDPLGPAELMGSPLTHRGRSVVDGVARPNPKPIRVVQGLADDPDGGGDWLRWRVGE